MASVARQIDRIDTAPAFTERDALRLDNLFRGVPTVEMLRTVLAEQMAGDIAIVSSFGAESAVLLHLVASIDPSVPVIFLDTGKHFPETLAYRDQLAARLGLTNLRIVTPDAEVIDPRNAKLALFRLDTATAKLIPLGTVPVGAGEAYGVCLYRTGGRLHAFNVIKDGTISAYCPTRHIPRPARSHRTGTASCPSLASRSATAAPAGHTSASPPCWY